ncbi:hypothetical protein S83_054360 [Arachis hypogaea]
MMSKLTRNNEIEKLVEIDEIRFGFLRLVPNWSMKQAIMVHLAESYEVKTRTFILDVGNIHLNAELIGCIFGIPSSGDPFPILDDENPSHMAIKKRFHRRTTTEFRFLRLAAWTSESLEKKAQYIISEGGLLNRKEKNKDVEGRSPQVERRKAAQKKNTTKAWTKSFGCTKGSSIGGESEQEAMERRPTGSTTDPPPIRKRSRRAER